MNFKSITEAQKKDWKARFGDLYQIDVETSGKKAGFIVCKPDRRVMNAIAAYNDKIDKVNNVLIKNCVLGGDMQLLDTDGSVYVEVIKQLGEMLTQSRSSLKKL